MTHEEIAAAVQSLKGWEVVEIGGISRLRKTFKFGNFADALILTIQVGNLAEQEDHHPEILTEWGKVTITWWTHTVKGLSKHDFAMAAQVDEL